MLNVPKNNAMMTKVFAGGKLQGFVTELVLRAGITANGLAQHWSAEVKQVAGKETTELTLAKGEVLLVEEIYLDTKQEVCVSLFKWDPEAEAKLELARKEDAEKVAADLKAQEEAKARAAAIEETRKKAEEGTPAVGTFGMNVDADAPGSPAEEAPSEAPDGQA